MQGLIIGLYVLSGLVLIGVVALIVVLLFTSKKSGGSGDISKNIDALKSDVEAYIKVENSMLLGTFNAQNANIKALSDSVNNLKESVVDKLANNANETSKSVSELKTQLLKDLYELKTSVLNALDKVREANASALKDMSGENSKQLTLMREVVDEKLNSTLEKRFDASFKLVGDRLEEINRTFTELQGLQSKVGDLSKILSNIKTRGGWGEVSLENLLSQILAPSQYEKQKQLKRASREAVDFAIRLPGKGDEPVYLPIDSKFPLEDYSRLQRAEDEADIGGIDEAKKAIYQRIKGEAKSIRDKYVNPPTTTNFAIMYLPIEGLYAEVLKHSELVETIQHDYRVVICGPTTIAALLNSLQMGFQTVAVEKQSKEIGKLLKKFETDFGTFVTLLEKSGGKIELAQKSIDDAEKKAKKIRDALSKFTLPEEQMAEIAAEREQEETNSETEGEDYDD